MKTKEIIYKTLACLWIGLLLFRHIMDLTNCGFDKTWIILATLGWFFITRWSFKQIDSFFK